MEQGVFSRFAESLKGQRDALASWMRSASPGEKQIRLGPAAEGTIENHIGVLERAIGKAETGELGRCTVCNDFVEQHWLEVDYTSSVCIDHLNGEQRNRLEAELELSQKVQKALLPQTVPALPGWEVAVFSRPASIVGGDYFDFGRFSNGHQAFVIADVMGKGMPASMLMASLQASLRIIIPESDTPSTVLDRVNQVFRHNINLTKFVTIVVAELDPGTGILRYANAGHNPPLVVRRGAGNGAACTDLLLPTGAAIGLLEDAHFEAKEIQLEAGDALFFYTDGVTDAGLHAGETYGDDRLLQFLKKNRSQSADLMMRGILQELRTFTRDAPLADDATIMVVKRRNLV